MLSLFERSSVYLIEDLVVSRIFEPLVNLAIHVIPALALLRINSCPKEQSSKGGSICCGARDSVRKAPDPATFAIFVEKISKVDRRVIACLTEKLYERGGASALYDRIDIDAFELYDKLS